MLINSRRKNYAAIINSIKKKQYVKNVKQREGSGRTRSPISPGTNKAWEPGRHGNEKIRAPHEHKIVGCEPGLGRIFRTKYAKSSQIRIRYEGRPTSAREPLGLYFEIFYPTRPDPMKSGLCGCRAVSGPRSVGSSRSSTRPSPHPSLEGPGVD